MGDSTTEVPVCQGTKDDGTPCNSTILVEGYPYCIAHVPGGRAVLRAGGRKGAAISNARRTYMQGIQPEELPPLDSHEACQVWVEVLGRAVATGRIDPATANAARSQVDTWLRAHAEDLEGKMEAIQTRLDELEHRAGRS